MAIAAVDFVHLDLQCSKGDVLPDDHELVTIAPHLFEQPDPAEDPDPGEPVRVRGPLVNPPAPARERKKPANNHPTPKET